MSAVSGVLCRLLWYTSLAFETSNLITIEFTTTRRIAPDGLLLCFLDNTFVQQNQLVAVQSLQQGGSIWQQGDERQVAGADWKSSDFFTTHLSDYISPITATDVVSALASDPYYNISSSFSRYDDLTADQQGNPLPASLLQRTATSSEVDGVSSSSGHCLIVTGAWQANTRYQMTLSIQNPPAPAATSAAQPVTPPDLWLAPLSYREVQGTGGNTVGLQMLVRGSKQGQLCQLRPQVAPLLPQMFSGCDEAVKAGLLSADQRGDTTVSALHILQACIGALQAAAAGNASLAATFPYNVPPVAQGIGLDSNADVACGTGQELSSRFGGECIDCTDAASQGNMCTCQPGYTTNLIGPAACGPSINPTGNASDAAALAGQLCTLYGNAFDRMMQGQLSDRLVLNMYLDAFTRQAAYLLDWTSIYEANQTFVRDHIVDWRLPDSPSRRAGIAPNCSACLNGMFKDIYTGKQVQVRDDRFQAVNTFRLIGHLLYTAGYPCSQLWDPKDPLKNIYGRYDKAMCAQL